MNNTVRTPNRSFCRPSDDHHVTHKPHVVDEWIHEARHLPAPLRIQAYEIIGVHNRVAALQLRTQSKCLILQLFHMPQIPKSLSTIFSRIQGGWLQLGGKSAEREADSVCYLALMFMLPTAYRLVCTALFVEIFLHVLVMPQFNELLSWYPRSICERFSSDDVAEKPREEHELHAAKSVNLETLALRNEECDFACDADAISCVRTGLGGESANRAADRVWVLGRKLIMGNI
ncbi:hypothetical protein ACLOJK_026585 [Asimina triloba]